MAKEVDDWVTVSVPDTAPSAGAPTAAPAGPAQVNDWVTVPPPEKPTDLVQGAADMLRVGSNALTLGTWDRARAGLQAVTGPQTYDEALKEQVAKSQQAGERLGPFMRGTAQALGGLPLGLGVGSATNAVIGTAARPLAQRIGISAVEGALLGGAEAAGHTYTGNAADYLKAGAMGSVLGGGVGAAAPMVGAAGSTAGRWMSDRGWFGGPTRELAAAAQADRPGLNWVMNTPGARLPDAGPSMQGLAQGSVIGAGGPGRTALVNDLTARNAATGQRITADIDQAFGAAPVPSHVETGVRGNMQAMGPAYDAVFARARAIDPTPINDFLTNQISTTRGPAQAAMREVRGMLQLPDAPPGTLDPHPRSLQAARTAVRGMQQSADDPAVAAQLGRVYDRMTHELQTRVPGVRELDSAYAELGSQERAIMPAGQGARVFETGRAAVTRPVEMQEAMTEAARPKGVNVGPSAEAFRMSQATRGELDRIVGTNRNDLLKLESVLGQPQDWNAQKLGVVFGQDRADRLMDVLARERRFRDTHQKVVEGSQTAQREASKEALETGRGKIPLDTTILGGAGRLVQNTADLFRRGSAETKRDAIAQLMATQDPVAIRAQVTRLLNAEPRRDRREAITNELLRRMMVGAGSGYAADEGGR